MRAGTRWSCSKVRMKLSPSMVRDKIETSIKAVNDVTVEEALFCLASEQVGEQSARLFWLVCFAGFDQAHGGVGGLQLGL